MIKIGDKKIVTYEYKQKECEICGEPATHLLTFLLYNARTNPLSHGYGKDDISWCRDGEIYTCEKCKEKAIKNPPSGMKWCADFYAIKNGEMVNPQWVCDWVKISERLEE